MSHLHFFKVGEIITWAKYEYLILLGAFPDKVTLDIDFTNEAVVQCNVPGVKKTVVGDGHLQSNHKWIFILILLSSKNAVSGYCYYFVYSYSFLRNWSR